MAKLGLSVRNARLSFRVIKKGLRIAQPFSRTG
jgi:hypothetical protein